VASLVIGSPESIARWHEFQWKWVSPGVPSHYVTPALLFLRMGTPKPTENLAKSMRLIASALLC
jgi:hypothetical protein